MKLPGRVDGVMVEDKRIHILPDVIQDHYKNSSLWDKITDVRINTQSQHGWETYTVRLGRRKDTWKYQDWWRLVKQTWVN